MPSSKQYGRYMSPFSAASSATCPRCRLYVQVTRSAFIRTDRRLYTICMRKALQFQLNSVRMLAFGIALGYSFVSNATAQSLKPSNVIDLAHIKIAGTDCKASLPTGFSSIQWLDDSRLLASTYWAHCEASTAVDGKKFETEAVLFDVRGTTIATAHSHASMFTKGSHGTVAALQDGSIELLDGNMHSVQTLHCPNSSELAE